MPSNNPKFVLISDVHYSLTNLELSDKAFRAAIDQAALLGVPLIDCGDITNDKAIIRGEVMNRMIDTFRYAESKGVVITCLVGNHSLLNEKGKGHALAFLEPYALVIEEFTMMYGAYFIPYQTDPEQFLIYLETIPAGALIIAHQGFKGADKGDYIVDKSAVDAQYVKWHKVFSGHYHCHQDIGSVTYVGNPYTMSFGEAKDGPKGFVVVNEDNTFYQVPLPYRRHVVVEKNASEFNSEAIKFREEDLVWLKVTGTSEELSGIKNDTGFKMDKIVIDAPKLNIETSALTGEQILDALIDNESDSDVNKKYLKQLWREVLNAT
jgi:hypothetical protein